MHSIGQGQHKDIHYTNYDGPELPTNFIEISPPLPEKMIFKGFYHVVPWWPSWSSDLIHLN